MRLKNLVLAMSAVALTVGCGNNSTGPSASIDPQGVRKYGHRLTTNERWSGRVHLTGDIIIPAGFSLTIDPGTIVSIATQVLDWDSASTKNKVDISSDGNFVANGTALQRITFTSDSSAPAISSWFGIGFTGGTMSLRYCTVACAHYGVFIFSGRTSSPLQCENCLFSYNIQGIVDFGNDNSYRHLTFDRCSYGYARFSSDNNADLSSCAFLDNSSIDVWSTAANQHISVSNSNFSGSGSVRNLCIFSSTNPQSCVITADSCYGITRVADSTAGGRGTIIQTNSASAPVPDAGCGFAGPVWPAAFVQESAKRINAAGDSAYAAQAAEINKRVYPNAF